MASTFNRILVTGGAGFVGSNLVRELQTRHPQADICVIDDFRSGSFANLSDEQGEGFAFRGTMIAGALHELDLDAILREFEPDVVFHEASITDTTVADQVRMLRDNVDPFVGLLNAALDDGFKLVWASSAATYGTRANGATAARRPFTLADAGQPANVYGFSKWVMENHARRAIAEEPKAHIVGLRYFNVFGPGEGNKGKMASMIYQLAQQMLVGKPPRIFRDGSQARDQVYVKDVVACTIAGAMDGAKPGIYNVGSGRATSFNDIVAAINQALGTNLAPDYFENPYSFYQDYTCADLSETQRGLKWSPAYPPAKAIIEYVHWLKARAER